MKLRYYSDDFDKERHEKKLELLNRIHNKWEIGIEIKRVRKRHGEIPNYGRPVAESSSEEAWKQDFRNNRALSQNLGPNRAPSDVFKSNSGNPQIASIIAIVDGPVQWGVQYQKGIEFLQEVLDEGEDVIEQVYTKGSESIHKQIQREFKEQKVLGKGEYRKDFTIGQSLVRNQDYKGKWSNFAKNHIQKEIDLLIKRDSVDWIIEIKPKFTSHQAEKALGQLMIYESIYSVEHPERKINKAVIFGALPNSGTAFDSGRLKAFQQIADIFQNQGVKIYMRHPGSKFKTLVNK